MTPLDRLYAVLAVIAIGWLVIMAIWSNDDDSQD